LANDRIQILESNQFLALIIPASNNALVFRVKSLANDKWYRFYYGTLPGLATSGGASLTSYTTTSTTIPATGVLPSQTFYTNGQQITPLTGMGAYDANDMFYTPDSYRNTLFHVYEFVTPRWLQVDLQIPLKTVQAGFQQQKVVGGISTNNWFGFNRGRLETVHLPLVHYGYRWGNDTSMSVYSSVVFVYGEYVVEIPRNADLVFDILTKKYTYGVRYVSLPIFAYQADVKNALRTTYGFEGFPLPRLDQRQQFTDQYKGLFGQIKDGV